MRKNILKISAIALLSAFALTSCSDDIIAKPEGYDGKNSPVVTITGYDKEIYNNTFTDIYDSIREGSLAQDVLNELLYQYSVSVFGNYNLITANKISKNPFGETTLKAKRFEVVFDFISCSQRVYCLNDTGEDESSP